MSRVAAHSAGPVPPGGAPIVVVGGGIAALSAVQELRRRSAGQPVVMVSEETRPPYDRTTLSKPDVLDHAGKEAPALWHQGDPLLDGVDLRLGTRATSLDPEARTVGLSDGSDIRFDRLLLATGAQPRQLRMEGDDAPGVHYLRTEEDASSLRQDLFHGRNVVIIGGGVIGLEVAASARALGRDVVVVEAASRIMSRYAPETLAADIRALHERNGVRFLVSAAPVKLEITGDRVSGVQLASGEILPAHVVVVGIGVVPEDGLAIGAGLEVDDGVVVNAHGETSDPHIWAAGDAARMRRDARDPIGVRLESWQPAARQGEHTAANMLGADTPYDEVPWTWSDQYDHTVQMAGTAQPDTHQAFFGAGDGSAVLTLEMRHDRRVLTAAYGMSRGAGIGKVIAAARVLIKHGAQVPDADLIEANDDHKRIGKVLARAAREVLAGHESAQTPGRESGESK